MSQSSSALAVEDVSITDHPEAFQNGFPVLSYPQMPPSRMGERGESQPIATAIRAFIRQMTPSKIVRVCRLFLISPRSPANSEKFLWVRQTLWFRFACLATWGRQRERVWEWLWGETAQWEIIDNLSLWCPLASQKVLTPTRFIDQSKSMNWYIITPN